MTLRLFPWLAGPAVLAFVGGLVGAMRTGQVDPWSWAAWVALPLVLIGLFARLWRGAILLWGATGLLGGIALFCFMASGSLPHVGDMAALALVAMLACGGAAGLRSGRRARRILGLAMLLLISVLHYALGSAQRWMPAEGPLPKLGVISALPLFWQEINTGPEARRDAPIITLLRAHFDIQPMDTAGPSQLRGVDNLLVAQPRAMPASELTTLDRWVHDGGTALILADPLLRWPTTLAPGDRRGPPIVAQLTPLLDRWGLRLAAPAADTIGERRMFLPGNRLLTLYGASHFVGTNDRCAAEAGGEVISCRIGKGRAVLVADADILDDRLWLSDAARVADPRAWSADTPRLLVAWLGGAAPKGPAWVSDRPHLIRAVRWGVISVLIWSLLGAVLLSRRVRLGKVGKRNVAAGFQQASDGTDKEQISKNPDKKDK